MLNRWSFLKTGFYEGINTLLVDLPNYVTRGHANVCRRQSFIPIFGLSVDGNGLVVILTGIPQIKVIALRLDPLACREL